ncbi:ribonuclease H-like domain-containing protein, partial [Tanacetum coccineum]
MPSKFDLVLVDEDEYVFSESVTNVPNVAKSESKSSESKPKSVSERLIEYWISDSEDENETEFKSKQRKPSFAKVEFVKSNEHVKIPRESVEKVEHNKQAKYPRKNSQSPRDYEEIDGGFVAFGGDLKGGKITGKGKISTDTECVVLSPDFKLLDENYVLLRVPRKDNMYNVDLKNIVPSGCLTCLFAKATLDESNLWHKRLGHINFKTMNKLVRKNLVRGLPSKIFENNHTCVACQKGKQHKASCRKPALSFMRPFGCPVTILNTLYHLVVAGNQTNGNADTKENIDACQAGKKIVPDQEYILLPLLTYDPSFSKSSKDSPNAGFKPSGEEEKIDSEH